MTPISPPPLAPLPPPPLARPALSLGAGPSCSRRLPLRLLDYQRYLDLQQRLRRRRRELLLFCQHPPTLTVGVQGGDDSLLASRELLAKREIDIFETGRGGDYTAHEPGQCLIYPHIDIKRRRLPISELFSSLLEITAAAIQKVWRIPTYSDCHARGLYHTPSGMKLVSIGLMFKGFFTSHGLALNICNSLETFRYIHPCGYKNLSIATIEQYGGDAALLGKFIALWNDGLQQYLLREKQQGK